MNSLVKRLGGREDDDEIADTVKCRQRGKQTNYRGNNHGERAMEGLESSSYSHQGRSQRAMAGGNRQQGGQKGRSRGHSTVRTGRVMSTQSGDPLDQSAFQRNRADRSHSSPAPASRNRKGENVQYVDRANSGVKRAGNARSSITKSMAGHSPMMILNLLPPWPIRRPSLLRISVFLRNSRRRILKRYQRLPRHLKQRI